MTTLEQVQQILEHRRITELIGLKEDGWFEAKENHEFDLDGSPRHRVELSKDVSAFANADGGFLIIGLKTERVENEQTDCVTQLDLFSQADFPRSQFEGVIMDSVYPSISGLEVKWIESSETPGVGIGCITIPKQDASLQPFLMKRVMEGNDSLQQIVFGVARRTGASNQPLTMRLLHSAMQNGKSGTSERLTRIEDQIRELLDRLPTLATALAAPADILDERVERAFLDD